jgi:hypothetical protein
VSLRAFKVTVGSVALICLGAGAANAATSSPAASATWRPGPASIAGTTTAVTGVRASGSTTEFAFVTNNSTHQMYERTNSKAWARLSGPALANGETVVEAKAITASDVVAFTVEKAGTSRVLSYVKGKWAVIGKFGAPIGSATVLSRSNIWVFGATVGKALGVWHYNGKSWKRDRTSGTDGSGVAAASAWAVQGASVDHLAGGKWTGTSLASLIPKAKIGTRSLVGVYATPGSPVYAVGSGNNEDTGGPIVVLQLNGHSWKKVATYAHGNMRATAVSPDGQGGLLIGGSAGAGASAELLHFVKGSGKLVAESVSGMTNVSDSVFFTAANVPGTTVEIIGGVAGQVAGKARIYTTN